MDEMKGLMIGYMDEEKEGWVGGRTNYPPNRAEVL